MPIEFGASSGVSTPQTTASTGSPGTGATAGQTGPAAKRDGIAYASVNPNAHQPTLIPQPPPPPIDQNDGDHSAPVALDDDFSITPQAVGAGATGVGAVTAAGGSTGTGGTTSTGGSANAGGPVGAGSSTSTSGAASTNGATGGSSAQSTQPALSDQEYADAKAKSGFNTNLQSSVESAYRGIRSNKPTVYDPKFRDTSQPDNIFNPQHADLLSQPKTANGDVYRFHHDPAWVRTYNGNNEPEKQVVSINAEPSAGMTQELDDFMSKHKDCVSQYKFPTNAEKWAGRRDPITMYVTDPEKFKNSGAQQELADIAKRYNRGYDPKKVQDLFEKTGKKPPDPDAKLLGKSIGPGAKVADYPSQSDIAALKARAAAINPQCSGSLEQTLKRNGGDLSVGEYQAWSDSLDKLEKNSRLGDAAKAGDSAAGKPSAEQPKDGPLGKFTQDSGELSGITKTGDLGKYHNSMNQVNLEAGNLADAKARNAPQSELDAISARLGHALNDADGTYTGMNDADKKTAAAEDKSLGSEHTPATDSKASSSIYEKLKAYNPKIAETGGQIETAAQRLSDVATSEANAGKTAAEIGADVGKIGGRVLGAAAGAAVGGIISGGFDIKDLVDGVKSGDKEKQKQAGIALAADIVTGGMYSFFKDMFSTTPDMSKFDETMTETAKDPGPILSSME